jgi:hypothetical protein
MSMTIIPAFKMTTDAVLFRGICTSPFEKFSFFLKTSGKMTAHAIDA